MLPRIGATGFRRTTSCCVVALALLLARPVHAAAGINLWWEGCTDEGGVPLATFACDVNTGASTLWASFTPVDTVHAFIAAEGIIGLCAMTSTLPAWWQFYNPGACRQTALSASADFSTAPGTHCVDLWGGRANGGIAGYALTQGTDWSCARLRVAFALDVPLDLPGTGEFYAFKVVVQHAGTTGAGACEGCATPVCIVLRELHAEGVHEDQHLTQPLENVTVQWQSIQPLCPNLVSVRAASWGRVKALYRGQ